MIEEMENAFFIFFNLDFGQTYGSNKGEFVRFITFLFVNGSAMNNSSAYVLHLL